ncbi:peptidase S8 and S53 subtilisin kexin sedolisin, partial [Pseudomonas sp. SIMBA_059]
MCLFASVAGAAGDTLRIKQLQRCGDLPDARLPQWCLRSEGLGPQMPAVWLGDAQLPQADIERQGDNLKLTLHS